MAAVAAGEGCASVVGFGGGSPMDVAKLAAYLIATRRGSRHALGRRQGDRAASCRWRWCRPRPGTGSEATAVTVITVGGSEKRGVNSPALYADWAVLDAELTLEPAAPRHRRDRDRRDGPCDRGLYLGAAQESDVGHVRAQGAAADLRQSAARLRPAGRSSRRAARCCSPRISPAIAFANAPVAGVHALAYPLGGHFHVPHGLSNALMLTHVLGHNMEAARPLYAELGAMLDPSVKDIGQQGQAQAFVQHLGAAVARGRRAAAAVRGRHRPRASRSARRRGDEAGAAADQQSLPDQRGGRAAALRGGALSREPLKGRAPIRSGARSRPAGPTMTPTATSTTPSITPGSTRR